MTLSRRRIRAVLGAVVGALLVFGAFGALLVFGAFGAFSALGVGRSAAEICTNLDQDDEVLVGVTRIWLPVVGVSCTWAPESDVRFVRTVFDHRATGFAVLGAVLVGVSLRAGTRRPSRRR